MTKTIIYTCDICGKEEDCNENLPRGWIETSGQQNRCPDCIGIPYPDDVLCKCGHYKYQDHYPVMEKKLPCEKCDCQEFVPAEDGD